MIKLRNKQEQEWEYVHKDRKLKRDIQIELIDNEINRIDSKRYIVIQTKE